VIGIRDSAADCLVIAMAHTDSVPPAPGADDNASGVGALVAIARALAAGAAPACDVWLVATGAEERPYTGLTYHAGAQALVDRLRKTDRLKDVRLALSLDEVGRGTRFDLHSTAARRGKVENAFPRARWVQDPQGEGNSDHRELARAGVPAAKLGVVTENCRHTACDTPDRLQRPAFGTVLKMVWPLLRTYA
jgi:Zn-dependent M28 family amino/carboxypeptidase